MEESNRKEVRVIRHAWKDAQNDCWTDIAICPSGDRPWPGDLKLDALSDELAEAFKRTHWLGYFSNSATGCEFCQRHPVGTAWACADVERLRDHGFRPVYDVPTTNVAPSIEPRWKPGVEPFNQQAVVRARQQKK